MHYDAPLVATASMGLVIIGRNEGERLLHTARRIDPKLPAIYVDSGSSDGSAQAVRSLGLRVIELDNSVPYSPGRGRNAGARALLKTFPELAVIHFNDGDCRLSADWPARAMSEFGRESRLAVLAGRLEEVSPDATVYNRLMHLEWDCPPGADSAIGGNASIRVSAFNEVSGFNESLLAGEEADLHLRLRRRNWIVRRVRDPMAQHDADMTRFSQWWKRHVRSGHAVAEAAHLHQDGPEAHQQKQRRSNYVWGLALPAGAIAAAPFTLGASLTAASFGAGALYLKVFRYERGQGRSVADAELTARYTVLSKFPQALGQLKFLRRRLTGAAPEPFDHRES